MRDLLTEALTADNLSDPGDLAQYSGGRLDSPFRKRNGDIDYRAADARARRERSECVMRILRAVISATKPRTTR